ncbi:MAG: lectin like domain-containing protein [Methanocorpusculum sp.]|uniref:lectin like domain-containing protein n=1 Tax=Methanocorpusculum sp. TaxID=2058474 RepID=UPI00271E7FE6|nr:lectin like domain-containing protein [Methanocorpusculum sp.]MDO9523230.1 lectin like domain-containing protein [Methanocorpusculum sp.]
MSITPRLLLIALLLSALCILPAAAELPSSYDPRDLNLTPVITDQGNFGLCWAFAAVSSLESSMIYQDPENYTGIDLSPYHLAYFTYNREDISDLTSPFPGLEEIAGDITITPSWDIIDNIRGLNTGGYEYQGKYSLASGIGAVNESLVPFDSYGNNTPISPDLAISENEILLDSAFSISLDDTDAIKTHLMHSGAGILSFYVAYDEPYLTQIDTGDWAYYLGSTDKDTLPDAGGHAVLLIGWDDTFGSFDLTPDQDGAWLIQNSWGTDPANCSYIWISYNEPSLGGIFFYVGGEPPYDHNYQYDGGTLANDRPTDQTTVSIANVFTAGGDELIRTVSLDTNQSVRYSVSVYTDPTENAPDTGRLSAQQSGDIPYPGYYTIDLDEPVPIEKGQTFSVVYELETDGLLNISIDSSIVSEDAETVTFAKAGQSYLNDGTGWTDMSADGETNLRIKAFTNDTVFSITVDPVAVSIKEQGVSVTGTTNFAIGREITVTLVCPNGDVRAETAEVRKGSPANFWEVTFSPVKLTEEEYFVSAVRNEVLAEGVFVPSGFKDMLVFGAKGTIMPAKSVV